MAERYPNAQITAVSNSASQRAFIEAEAKRRGLAGLAVITADMNDFTAEDRFDRIVSVEMFEHMSNWRALLARARGWLKPDGRLFLHVFTHRSRAYAFDVSDEADWIAQHFFTGGIMPSHGLIRQFPDLVAVEAEWRWSGDHYRRTALHWLSSTTTATPRRSPRSPAGRLLAPIGLSSGAGRWRLFFLATAEASSETRAARVWGVSHYRLRAT